MLTKCILLVSELVNESMLLAVHLLSFEMQTYLNTTSSNVFPYSIARDDHGYLEIINDL